MLRTEPPTRKQRFKAALAVAGMTAKQWADEYGEKGVTVQHLGLVLLGERESPALLAAAEQFIVEQAKRATQAA